MTIDSNEGEKPKFQTLVVNETKYKTLLTPKYENRKAWVKPDEKKVYSVLPGTILKINVKKGSKVNEGQDLLLFEAMKMINTMKADRSGIIKDIYIQTGDKLPKNFLMLEYE